MVFCRLSIIRYGQGGEARKSHRLPHHEVHHLPRNHDRLHDRLAGEQLGDFFIGPRSGFQGGLIGSGSDSNPREACR